MTWNCFLINTSKYQVIIYLFTARPVTEHELTRESVLCNGVTFSIYIFPFFSLSDKSFLALLNFPSISFPNLRFILVACIKISDKTNLPAVTGCLSFYCCQGFYTISNSYFLIKQILYFEIVDTFKIYRHPYSGIPINWVSVSRRRNSEYNHIFSVFYNIVFCWIFECVVLSK